MEVLVHMEPQGYEQVVFNYDKVSGLKAIIAITTPLWAGPGRGQDVALQI